jgi:hypothetical protein
MSQENYLFNYLKHTKCLFQKQNRKVKQLLSGVGTSGRGGYNERVEEVNVVEYYVLMNENGKMRPVPGMGGGRIKRIMKGVSSTFVSVTVYPQYSNNMLIKNIKS